MKVGCYFIMAVVIRNDDLSTVRLDICKLQKKGNPKYLLENMLSCRQVPLVEVAVFKWIQHEYSQVQLC